MEGAAEAVALYRAAIAESERFPGEPLHTKAIGLAERLVELGATEEAALWLEKVDAEAILMNNESSISRARLLSAVLKT